MYYWWCSKGRHYVTNHEYGSDRHTDGYPVCPREEVVMRPGYVIYPQYEVIDGTSNAELPQRHTAI